MAALSSPQWFTAAVTESNSRNKESVNSFNNYKSLSYESSYSLRGTSLSKNLMVDTPTKTNVRLVKFDYREDARVVHRVESSDEVDLPKLWFSKQEILSLRKEGRDMLAKVKDAGGDLSALDESIGESIRGLEHGLSVDDNDGSFSVSDDVDAAPLNRSKRRKNIIATILAQQQDQKEAGIDDPRGLCVTSKACTQWAVDRAAEQAGKDFEAAVQVWREDEACAELLPSILNKKTRRPIARKRSSVVSDQRQATLATITKSLASALEELDDLDF